MEANSSPSSSSNSSTTQANANASASSNAASLPISTSSSWTILPPDRIEILDNGSSTSSEQSSTSNKVEEREQEPQEESKECTKDSSEHVNESCKPGEDADAQAEDVSDGISIISDCESTGRLTPHNYLCEHLDVNLKYRPRHGLSSSLFNMKVREPCDEPQLRERRRRPSMEPDDDALEPQATQPNAAAPVVRADGELSPSTPVVPYRRLPAVVRSGLTAFFYVATTLAILAFIGRLRSPEWQVLSGDKPIVELEQKLGELELQNNLMRAEIDIMSKQLHYLNSLANGQAEAQGRKGKAFKAWPGSGNSVDPVDITKQDLKRPYKCPDGKFVEIAAMCVESKPHAESLADEIGNVVNDVLRQAQAFQNFEKVTERLGTLAGNDAEPGAASDNSKAFHAHGDKAAEAAAKHAQREPMPVPNAKLRSDSSKERYKAKHNHKRQEHDDSQSKEHDSKERFNRKHGDKSKERYDKSKERYDKSKERYDKSKERYDKSKERYDKSKERGKKHHGHGEDSGSGEWHARMMQHREQSRQRHEQKRSNNWYIERGGSREQIRSGETRR